MVELADKNLYHFLSLYSSASFQVSNNVRNEEKVIKRSSIYTLPYIVLFLPSNENRKETFCFFFVTIHACCFYFLSMTNRKNNDKEKTRHREGLCGTRSLLIGGEGVGIFI
jgi:hypothetical protein